MGDMSDRVTYLREQKEIQRKKVHYNCYLEQLSQAGNFLTTLLFLQVDKLYIVKLFVYV